MTSGAFVPFYACVTLAAGDSCWLGTFEILSAPLLEIIRKISESSGIARSFQCFCDISALQPVRIPLVKILGPPLLADGPAAHLKWISKALDSEKRYLALFDQDGTERGPKGDRKKNGQLHPEKAWHLSDDGR